jgi:hypothetical protein
MKHFMQIVTPLAVCTVFAVQAFAGDLSSLLPPAASQTKQANVPRQEKTIRVGEVVKMPLPGNRSYIFPVEVDGDSIRIVDHDPFGSLTLQGARPGLSTVRIFRKFWRDPDIRASYVPVEEIVISVAAKSSWKGIDAPQANREEVPVPRENAALDWEGFISHQSEELLTVITDNKEWTSLWKSAFGKPAPQVDFDSYAIACVFLGFHADWLYGIHFEEAIEEGNLLVLPYGLTEIILELSGPFQASGQYRMKAFLKKKGYGMLLQKQQDSFS